MKKRIPEFDAPEFEAPEFEPKAGLNQSGEVWEPRHFHVMIRFTSKEKEAIRLAAYQDGRTITAWVRWMALGGLK